MKQIEEYIISFLCFGDNEAAKRVHVDGEVDWTLRYPTAVKEQAFRKYREEVYISPDIVYNTFFYISRAEELINPKRDEHGRFSAQCSILSQGNQLLTPAVDEYSRQLMKTLQCALPEPGFGHIYLTHDIDSIDQYRHLRGALGAIKRGEIKQMISSWKDIHNDPVYTFPWLIEQDSKVKQAEVFYFVKNTAGLGYDYPQYNLRRKDYIRIESLLRQSGATIGLHSSYYGELPTECPKNHRSHYLRCSIDQMQKLVDTGITEDFTMGFPDRIGFRLQTTRTVRWINPKTMSLTPLMLHPLMIMDTTLTEKKYMNLSEEEAFFSCEMLIERVRLHHGDLCILWHNHHPAGDKYLTALYPKVIDLIRSK